MSKSNIVILMVLSMILLSTAGCGKRKEQNENYKEMIYDMELLNLNGVSGEPQAIVYNEGKLYINMIQWENGGQEVDNEENADESHMHGEDGQICSKLYYVNTDGSDWKEIPINIQNGELIRTVLIGENGEIFCVVQNDNTEKVKSSMLLVKFNEEGKELLKEDITNIYDLNEEDDNIEFVTDKQGNVVVAAGKNVYLFDNTLKCVGEVYSPNLINGIGLTKDGQVICGSMMYEEESICSQVQILDLDDKKWKKTIKLGDEVLQETGCLMNGGEWDFYFRTESGIYGYNIENKDSLKLLDYLASNLESDEIYGMASLGDGRFISLTHGTEMGIYIYTKVDPATIPDKITITYGGLYVSDEIKTAASTFNRKNRQYQIEFKEYGSIEKMNVDIIAGNITDIIDLKYQPMEQYVEKGILEDLTPYFDSDPELSETDIIDSVRQAMLIDDKLYFVSPKFGVDTIVAKVKDVGNRTGWTFEEMDSFLNEQDDGIRPFYSDNKEDLLDIFLLYGSTDYIDWQSGKCSYTSQNFKNILEFCNSGTDKRADSDDYWKNMISDIQEGKELFSNVYGLGVGEIQVYHQIFGDDITYIGYPNMDKDGSCFRFDTQIGISAQSKEKEGAWEFIRTFMTQKYQGDSESWLNGSAPSPTRQDCFDMMIKAKTATESYTDEMGQTIEPASNSWWWNDIEVKARPLTQEEVSRYIDLINRTKKRTSYDYSVEKIIKEEAKPYFLGEKSLDETVNIIQMRIETYVNEIR